MGGKISSRSSKGKVESNLEGDGVEPSEPQRKGLNKTSRRLRPYKETMNVNTEPKYLVPSPVAIRQAQLKVMEDQRPHLTPKQMEIIVFTWNLLRDDHGLVGSSLFIKYVWALSYLHTNSQWLSVQFVTYTCLTCIHITEKKKP